VRIITIDLAILDVATKLDTFTTYMVVNEVRYSNIISVRIGRHCGAKSPATRERVILPFFVTCKLQLI